MFRWFEKLVNPFPSQPIQVTSKSFWAFAWGCTAGMRPYILAMTLLTAVIGAFEALLFAMMGKIVDWLSKVQPDQLWVQEKIIYCCWLAL
jgi:ATP-binding cassette subfamily B multidrug efflux pump